jgi:hypothetical protein
MELFLIEGKSNQILPLEDGVAEDDNCACFDGCARPDAWQCHLEWLQRIFLSCTRTGVICLTTTLRQRNARGITLGRGNHGIIPAGTANF